jgi:hypothetical protein
VTADRSTVGWREWVGLPDLGIPWVKAKVDTGARSSSLHAWDVRVDEATGQVRFAVHPFQHDDVLTIPVRAHLVGMRDVRSSNGDVERRPAIVTTAAIAGEVVPIELTLTNRDDMGFRMLLGRSARERRVLGDAGRSFLGGGDRHRPPAEMPAPGATGP